MRISIPSATTNNSTASALPVVFFVENFFVAGLAAKFGNCLNQTVISEKRDIVHRANFV